MPLRGLDMRGNADLGDFRMFQVSFVGLWRADFVFFFFFFPLERPVVFSMLESSRALYENHFHHMKGMRVDLSEFPKAPSIVSVVFGSENVGPDLEAGVGKRLLSSIRTMLPCCFFLSLRPIVGLPVTKRLWWDLIATTSEAMMLRVGLSSQLRGWIQLPGSSLRSSCRCFCWPRHLQIHWPFVAEGKPC